MPDRPRRILLVQDDFPVREALAALLEDAGYRVTSASNGREALAYLDRCRPAVLPRLIITDLNMPHMSGRALIGELQRVTRYARIPIIAMSATAPDELETLGRSVEVFRKPIEDLPRFLDALKGALSEGSSR